MRRLNILDAIGELPPLHQVAQRLIAMMGSDLTSARDLDRMIRSDQALTARVLKVANSSIYGKSRAISSLTDAVVLLGHRTLTELVLSIGVADVLGDDALPGFGAAAWEHSLDCAAGARAVADVTGVVTPETAFVAGLMHDIGLLVMARAEPRALAEVLAADPDDPLAAERAALGLNHPQVGTRMLNQWNLPHPICEAVRYHHAPSAKFATGNPLVIVVALADLLTSIDGACLYPTGGRADLFRLLAWAGIGPDRFPALFLRLGENREAARRLLASLRENGGTAAPPAADPVGQRAFTVFASDQTRVAWHQSVLRYLGCRVLPWQAALEQAGEDDAPPYLLADLRGVPPEARRRLDQVSLNLNLPLAVIGDDEAAHCAAAHHLPDLLSRPALCALETAVNGPDTARSREAVEALYRG
jgi:HD-like signal output (HDOD) protein